MRRSKEYQRRNNIIHAMQHDGTNRSAIEIENWILLNGGKCEVFLIGSTEFHDKEHAYIRLASSRSANLVIPGSYVVRVQEGLFYAVLEGDFHILYEEVVKPVEVSEEPVLEVPD